MHTQSLNAEDYFSPTDIDRFFQMLDEFQHHELFLLDDKIVQNANTDDVNSILDDLRELQIDKPPFEKFVVQMNTMAFFRRNHPEDKAKYLANNSTVTRLYVTYNPLNQPHYKMMMASKHDDGSWGPMLVEEKGEMVPPEDEGYFMLLLLIATLATRNAVKQRHTISGNLSKRHPLSGRSHYTLIAPPATSLLENDDTCMTGCTMTPHLRRGHIRRQHFGVAMSQVKKIWIQPVFVNADANFVANNARLGYRVRR